MWCCEFRFGNDGIFVGFERKGTRLRVPEECAEGASTLLFGSSGEDLGGTDENKYGKASLRQSGSAFGAAFYGTPEGVPFRG